MPRNLLRNDHLTLCWTPIPQPTNPLWLNHQMGDTALAYKISNLLMHLLCVVLLYGLMLRLGVSRTTAVIDRSVQATSGRRGAYSTHCAQSTQTNRKQRPWHDQQRVQHDPLGLEQRPHNALASYYALGMAHVRYLIMYCNTCYAYSFTLHRLCTSSPTLLP